MDLVNPSTKVSVANLKDEIETAKLSSFEHDIKKFNTWFSDKQNLIVKEVGENGYTEYLRCLFKTYLTAIDPKFVEAVTQERRLWMMGRQVDTYEYADLISFALTLYNNRVALSEWKGGKRQLADKTKTSTGGEEPKFLALLTEIQTAIRDGNLTSNPGGANDGGTGTGKGGNNGGSEGGSGRFQGAKGSWKFRNPDNLKTMERNDRTWKWCENDCHAKPMWCPRPNCMSREAYKEHMQSEKETAGKNATGKFNATKDFKVALLALISNEEYKALEGQFLN